MACRKAKRKCCKFGFRKGTLKCRKAPRRRGRKSRK